MTQTKEIIHCAAHFHTEVPRLFSTEGTVRAVQTVDRRKDSVLIPSCFKLIVTVAEHMAADIMTPPSVADVGGCAGKVWLEIQGFPGDVGVSGKSDRIAVGARSCIAGEGHRTFSVSSTVKKMIVIQHPQRIKTLDLGTLSLLPVNPPEIDALFFHRMMDFFEIYIDKFRIGNVKIDRLFFFCIHSHSFCYFRIAVLIRTNSVCRMDIQCCLHAACMEFSKKTLRIREEFFIPAIAGPAAAVFRIHIVYTVPVHIDNSNREWNVLFVEVFHQFHIRCFTVTPVTAPPVSECKSRKHRSFAAKVIKIL